jgi:hypothetical protein
VEHRLLPLVMEKTNLLFHDDDAELLGSLIHSGVILTTTRCCNIFGARATCTVNIVDEGELCRRLVYV